MPGTVLGPLLPSVARQDRARRRPGGRARLPRHGLGGRRRARRDSDDFAYISSGTWSLVGVEVPEPVITDDSLANNFTNEGGVGGRFRLLRNVQGLWLVQECRRVWAEQGSDFSYDELAGMAEAAPPFSAVIDPDATSFLDPPDVPAAIRSFCTDTGQAPPQDRGGIVRCILESVALKHRWVLERIEKMQGRPVSVVHIVGGGSRNRLLCQFTADATGRPVLAGPAEATAVGNIIVQAMALGHLSSAAEGRALVRRSFETERYEPRGRAPWDEMYGRLVAILGSHGID